MEEKDNCEGLLRKALAVNDIPKDFDPNKVPQTGEEYIHQVMYEARQCKDWVAIDIDTEKFQPNQTTVIEEPTGLLPAPPTMVPTLFWQQKQIADFSAFRLYVQKLKLDNPVDNPPPFNGESDQWLKKCVAPPELSEIICLNQKYLCKILTFQLGWLEDIKPGESLSFAIGVWFYSVLACLEQPLMPETCADLRAIARKCSHIRAALPITANEKQYKSLNLIICLIARHFNNFDLMDAGSEI